MNRHMTKIIGLTAIILLLGASSTSGDTGNITWPALRCLPSLHVTVGGTNPGRDSAGPSVEWIRSDFEQRLQKAGIRVQSDDEWFGTGRHSPEAAFLYVDLSPIRQNPPTKYSFAVRLELNRPAVASYCDSTIAMWAPVWFTYAHAVCSVGDYDKFARQVLADKLTAFLKDYLAANGKTEE